MCFTSVSTFVSAVTGHELVLDLAGLLLFGKCRLEAGGAVGVVPRELADRAVERGREEHRLAIARQPADDAVDLRLEAHVEHPVGLVEDENADVREVDEPALGEILRDVRALRPGCARSSRASPGR